MGVYHRPGTVESFGLQAQDRVRRFFLPFQRRIKAGMILTHGIAVVASEELVNDSR